MTQVTGASWTPKHDLPSSSLFSPAKIYYPTSLQDLIQNLPPERISDMQTAFSITDVTFSATFNPLPPAQGGGSSLTVNFQILNQGPNHLAGLIVTTNSWATWQILPASFVRFSGTAESWTAHFEVQNRVTTFEFVIFCDDLGGVSTAPRIWNTNAGTVFQATVT